MSRHHIAPAHNDVSFGYACDENRIILSIDDINVNYRKAHKFYCLNCGKEMVASLKDDIRRRHFRHKNTEDCDFNKYLHNLSEKLIKKVYDDADCFYLEYDIDIECINASCKYKNANCIGKKEKRVINLKEFYPSCSIEKGVKGEDGNNYIADILLTGNKPNYPPLLIEIFVSHECTLQKKTSGLRIVELKINTEEDITDICSSRKIVKNGGVSLYNFILSRKEQLDSKILKYVYSKEKGSNLISVSCQQVSAVTDENSLLEVNVIKNDFISKNDIEQYINRRYRLEKDVEPSCENCAHYFQYNKMADETTEPPYCYYTQDLCDKYKKREKNSKGSKNYIENIDYEIIKKDLPNDFKVVIYAPHKFYNPYIIRNRVKYFLKNKLENEVVVLTCPLSSSTLNLSSSVVGAAEYLSVAYEYKIEDWEKNGKSAAYKCISELLKDASAVIAFHDGKDKLTSHLIEQTKNKNIPLRVVDLTQRKEICPKCYSPLTLKYGKNGVFIGCSSYPDCTYTQPYNENLWNKIKNVNFLQ
ncbi:MAG: topoisomerase DNA-binding C4 zinc finger domain-containing protein [Prevotella sp.]|nr:topoisomerase DNA-binding C4 zinc finger domain-containing protein [Prevotella sp.]